MRTSEIRTRWLDYFASKGHEIRPSVPLISNDPSILFTIAGMVPFIPYITGEEPAPWPRAASVQKCIRTNDIDNVGRTTRHGTFFQMNGNFSFGDYFKEGAIEFAWDLLTGPLDQGRYGLDGDRLWVTLWERDDESYDMLTRAIGMDPRHIVRLPREENFWDTGQPGPAGPCCEWHYDRGPAFGPEAEGGTVDPGGDRYLELWNLVFDQYMRGEGEGKDYPLLGELDKKCIDTGAGLERLAFVLQDKANMYEIDEVFPVIEAVQEMSGRRYHADAEDDVRMRVVADHVRSALMLIGDGVRPGNDGRGYVLRRLVRRAIRSMRLLGVEDPALPVLLPVSRDAMSPSYPELVTDWDTISDVAYGEEEAFRRTLSAGTTILDTAVAHAKESDGPAVITGEDAFTLHDTYGFPIDLTLEMAAEQGVSVDETRFRALMGEQRERARADARAKKTGHVDVRVFHDFATRLGGGSRFLGYTEDVSDARIEGILVDGVAQPAVSAPAEVEIILDQTPFYAEMGGQLADHGTIRTADGALVRVGDVQAPIKGLSVHRGTLVEGTLALGEEAVARIDPVRRLAIARAHTSTHMVHKALHEVVSESATQAGSENAPSRLRFDFRHGSALSPDQVDGIEELVNEKLSEDLAVTDTVMPIEEARKTGAMALFGEKYGKEVRVVSIGGDWSKEFCAGTHVPSTGRIGRVAVLGESSIGSGVRRIDALVGDAAFGFQAKEHALVSQLSALVGGRAEDLPGRVESLMMRLRDAERSLERLSREQALARAGELAASAGRVGDLLVVAASAGAVASADALRALTLDVRDRLGTQGGARGVVVVLVGVASGRPCVVAATDEAARGAGANAGALVRTAARRLGGGGGGRADVAQGGGTDVSAVDDALGAVTREIEAL
ncbi:MAG: alanine--tRNA ligase [Actinomyces sp.]|jgi:alanyl-tRNA synthetase|nr:alanine--tRNA ligase [Actinomyces sp.]MCI1641106.1 alanine--tRNA ligase [Actinomyces sp.]MCI1662375.1 alanine--tRNA ligase [Actinomyces sp.]MCI1691099.1 alanine--tRNA ligase [Actinomyces sp.]MCI1787123.1 alanine--tRNA ligase [Actinomyces sp.]MCI1829311.1 alanine--tRNA ligase [Actinomyces sp.]